MVGARNKRGILETGTWGDGDAVAGKKGRQSAEEGAQEGEGAVSISPPVGSGLTTNRVDRGSHGAGLRAEDGAVEDMRGVGVDEEEEEEDEAEEEEEGEEEEEDEEEEEEGEYEEEEEEEEEEAEYEGDAAADTSSGSPSGAPWREAAEEQAWCYSLGRGTHPIGVQPSGNLLLPPTDSSPPDTDTSPAPGAAARTNKLNGDFLLPEGAQSGDNPVVPASGDRGDKPVSEYRTEGGEVGGSGSGGGMGRRRNCRDAGLGALGRLPDALLLEGVMAVLGPRELGALCCASHAAHAFAMHEDLWRALALGELGGEFEFQGTWRDTYLAATGRAGGALRGGTSPLGGSGSGTHTGTEGAGGLEGSGAQCNGDRGKGGAENQRGGSAEGHSSEGVASASNGEIAPVGARKKKVFQVRNFYSDYLFQAWLCASLDLKADWLKAESIPRRDARTLSPEDFVREFERPRRPVILTHCIDDWGALRRWDRAYLEAACGDRPLACGPVAMTLPRFFRYSSAVTEEKPLYVFDPRFAEAGPQLAQDYCVPRFFQEDLFSVLEDTPNPPGGTAHSYGGGSEPQAGAGALPGCPGCTAREGGCSGGTAPQTGAQQQQEEGPRECRCQPQRLRPGSEQGARPGPGGGGREGRDGRPDYRWLIIGPRRSGSSWHIDPNATSAWNAVVRGAKKWVLFPPGAAAPPGVHPSADGADVAAPVSLPEWFMNHYGQLGGGQGGTLEGVCRQGEVVFVPHGWWHAVLNLEESVAITQNYVSRSNLLDVLSFLRRPNAAALVSGTSQRESLHDRFRARLRERRPGLLEAVEAEAEAARLAAAKAKGRHSLQWEARAALDQSSGGFRFNF